MMTARQMNSLYRLSLVKDGKPVGNDSMTMIPLSSSTSVRTAQERSHEHSVMTSLHGFARDETIKTLPMYVLQITMRPSRTKLVAFKKEQHQQYISVSSWLLTGQTQARIAETEKYAHVTFFFNGGVEEPNQGEDRILVKSPKVRNL